MSKLKFEFKYEGKDDSLLMVRKSNNEDWKLFSVINEDLREHFNSDQLLFVRTVIRGGRRNDFTEGTFEIKNNLVVFYFRNGEDKMLLTRRLK